MFSAQRGYHEYRGDIMSTEGHTMINMGKGMQINLSLTDGLKFTRRIAEGTKVSARPNKLVAELR